MLKKTGLRKALVASPLDFLNSTNLSLFISQSENLLVYHEVLSAEETVTSTYSARNQNLSADLAILKKKLDRLKRKVIFSLWFFDSKLHEQLQVLHMVKLDDWISLLVWSCPYSYARLTKFWRKLDNLIKINYTSIYLPLCWLLTQPSKSTIWLPSAWGLGKTKLLLKGDYKSLFSWETPLNCGLV